MCESWCLNTGSAVLTVTMLQLGYLQANSNDFARYGGVSTRHNRHFPKRPLRIRCSGGNRTAGDLTAL